MALTAALTRKHTPVNMYTPVLQPPSLGVTHRPGALVVHTGPQLLFGLTSDSHLHGPGAVSLGTFPFLLILSPSSYSSGSAGTSSAAQVCVRHVSRLRGSDLSQRAHHCKVMKSRQAVGTRG